ncbi:MAG: hypothetical protein ACO3WN_07740 [Burkholderiaceae bacterium]
MAEEKGHMLGYWVTRSLGMAAGLLLVFAALAYALDLVFLPPPSGNSSDWAPHWRAYSALWDFAEQVGRSGLREGLFPSVIRRFDDDGLPAFLPWVVLGLCLGILTLVSLFLANVLGSAPATPQEAHGREPALGPVAPPRHQERRIAQEAPLPAPPASIRVAPAVGGSTFARGLEQKLYDSEKALALATQSLEDLRRAAVNLVLDPTVAEVNEDLKEVHDALDALEMAFEQLRGQQHALMANLGQLTGYSATRESQTK